MFNICFFFSFHFVCLFIFFFCTRFTAQGRFTQHVAARIKSMQDFTGYRQVVVGDRAGTCMSSTKLQDKLMLILSLLSPFVITGKAESCRSRKPASAPARNLMNLFDLCRYCCPTQKFCSVKQLAGVRRVHSFHARFLFFFLSISTYTLCKFYQETSFP